MTKVQIGRFFMKGGSISPHALLSLSKETEIDLSTLETYLGKCNISKTDKGYEGVQINREEVDRILYEDDSDNDDMQTVAKSEYDMALAMRKKSEEEKVVLVKQLTHLKTQLQSKPNVDTESMDKMTQMMQQMINKMQTSNNQIINEYSSKYEAVKKERDMLKKEIKNLKSKRTRMVNESLKYLRKEIADISSNVTTIRAYTVDDYDGE